MCVRGGGVYGALKVREEPQKKQKKKKNGEPYPLLQPRDVSNVRES